MPTMAMRTVSSVLVDGHQPGKQQERHPCQHQQPQRLVNSRLLQDNDLAEKNHGDLHQDDGGQRVGRGDINIAEAPFAVQQGGDAPIGHAPENDWHHDTENFGQQIRGFSAVLVENEPGQMIG